jgi:hypothetical protein
VLDSIVNIPQFLYHMLWTDGTVFPRSGVHRLHNLHIWAMENLHVACHSSFKQRLSDSIWARIIGEYTVALPVVQDCLGGVHCTDFHEEVPPPLLEVMPLHLHESMYYQHDGALPHFRCQVHSWLENIFLGKWTEYGNPVTWPSCDPNLSP